MKSAERDLLNLKDASEWASLHLGKNVTTSNIRYLLQYGRIEKYGTNGDVLISKEELEEYYKKHHISRRDEFKRVLGTKLNWDLSFVQYTEAETTKHVHRLHPYKGKFIPQLVEYFLDQRTDQFKKVVFFQPGDVVIDPFLGSGTTLVQANELGLHGIGVDVSAFNVMLSSSKIKRYDFIDIEREIKRVTNALKTQIDYTQIMEFDQKLIEELRVFNNEYFPSPEYKRDLRLGKINEKDYASHKEEEFLPIYEQLVKEYGMKLLQDKDETFLDKWFLDPIRKEIDFMYKEILKIQNPDTRKILAIVLSRTVRSCRATTHSDLATLEKPVYQTYYCTKHGKLCKPLFTILKWWITYSKDTLKRLIEFNKLRTDTYQLCLTGDSRNIDIMAKTTELMPKLAELIRKNKIKGIFTSPPYVGLIDYHEQHAYAYDLFGFERKDDLEIGPLFKGQGKEAQESYVESIAQVLKNIKPLLDEDYNVFLVANDKYDLYPKIAEQADMQIVGRFERPVLNRTEKTKGAYAESIFHLKEK